MLAGKTLYDALAGTGEFNASVMVIGNSTTGAVNFGQVQLILWVEVKLPAVYVALGVPQPGLDNANPTVRVTVYVGGEPEGLLSLLHLFSELYQVKVLVMLLVALVPVKSTFKAPRHFAVAVVTDPASADESLIEFSAMFTHRSGEVLTRTQTLEEFCNAAIDQSNEVGYPAGATAGASGLSGTTGKNGNMPTVVPGLELKAESLMAVAYGAAQGYLVLPVMVLKAARETFISANTRFSMYGMSSSMVINTTVSLNGTMPDLDASAAFAG